jgi:hypothetical protein
MDPSFLSIEKTTNQWTERVYVAALEETGSVGERNHCLRSLSAASVEEPASTTGTVFLEKKPNTMLVVRDRGTCVLQNDI